MKPEGKHIDRQGGPEEAAAKPACLRGLIRGIDKAVVAFSGGTDSAFLLRVAGDILGDAVVAITVRAPLFPESEYREALGFCQDLGIRHEILYLDSDAIEGFAHNPPERCYLCKKSIFGKIRMTADALGIKTILDGTNFSDLDDYRPGLKALRELGVRSPLMEAGLVKEEIRALSRDMGLPTWNKPACACLASRIPYGEPITDVKLLQIDKAEHALHDMGFTQIRVRHHGDVARIEAAPTEMPLFLDAATMRRADAAVREAGFAYAALDLAGYRTGSMNETLSKGGGKTR